MGQESRDERRAQDLSFDVHCSPSTVRLAQSVQAEVGGASTSTFNVLPGRASLPQYLYSQGGPGCQSSDLRTQVSELSTQYSVLSTQFQKPSVRYGIQGRARWIRRCRRRTYGDRVQSQSRVRVRANGRTTNLITHNAQVPYTNRRRRRRGGLAWRLATWVFETSMHGVLRLLGFSVEA